MNPQLHFAPGWYNGCYWDGYQWVTSALQQPLYTNTGFQYLYTPEGVAYYYGMDGLTYYADGTPCYPVAPAETGGKPAGGSAPRGGAVGAGSGTKEGGGLSSLEKAADGAAGEPAENVALEDGRVVGVPVHGNMTTMNLDNVMYKAITQSRAFQNTPASRDLAIICEEIADKVTFLDPTLVNDKTHPSPAYCLMMRLHMARPTLSEIKSLFYSEDSVFVRGLAMLYMRYVTAPRELFPLFKPLLGDKEKFDPRGRLLGAKPVLITIGDWARVLLTEKKNGVAVLPPIPIPIQKEITEKLKNWQGGEAGDGDESKEDRRKRRRSTDEDERSGDHRRSRSSSKRPRAGEDDGEGDVDDSDRRGQRKNHGTEADGGDDSNKK